MNIRLSSSLIFLIKLKYSLYIDHILRVIIVYSVPESFTILVIKQKILTTSICRYYLPSGFMFLVWSLEYKTSVLMGYIKQIGHIFQRSCIIVCNVNSLFTTFKPVLPKLNFSTSQ